MNFTPGYGSFVARATLTTTKARALYAAGHRHVLIQVDYQGSKLTQRGAQRIADESAAAARAGLVVGWWAWVRPGGRGAGRRPGGVEALCRRLGELLAAGLTPPPLFVANCEVGGGWDPARPALGEVAAAARAAGMPRIGLSSHGIVGRRWDVFDFDIGLPQLYRREPLARRWAERCLASWRARGCKEVWPTLGAADSSVAEMASDLAVLASLSCYGATWWTARQLSGAKLAASVPAGLRGHGEGGPNA